MSQINTGVGNIPLRFALGHETSEQAIYDCKTNDDGSQNWPIPYWPVRDYTIHVNQGDYANPAWSSESRYIAQPADGQYPDQAFTLQRVSAERGFLHVVQDRYFATEDNQPWLFAGYASYTIISEVSKGKDITPFLDEALSYGANTLVCLGMDLGAFAHDHGFAVDPRDPNWPSWMAALCDATAAKGLRIAPGLFQQAQALADSEKQHCWQLFQDILRGRWNVLGRMGNEDDVNGWSHHDLPLPQNTGGVLYSTGSRGINNPPTPPNAQWAEWEPPRDPRAKTFSDAGGAGWYMWDGYPDFPACRMPIVCIEPPFFHETEFDQWGDRRWTSQDDALTLGLNIGANFAGGCFGLSEGLETRPNGPNAAACARQFFRGLRAGFVR